jgi:hypothetical protein
MRKLGVCVVFCIAMVAGLCLIQVRSADAYLNFSKAFLKKYTGDKSTDAQKSIASEFARVKKCGVCHDPRPGDDGKVSKKNRNPYGQALAKFLTEKDKKNTKKVLEMLGKVEGEKAEGAKDKETFGASLTAGKLPFLYEGFDYTGGKDDEKDDEKDGQ